MTRLPSSTRPDAPVARSADRSELLGLLAENLLPDMPMIEVLLDRIERQGGRP